MGEKYKQSFCKYGGEEELKQGRRILKKEELGYFMYGYKFPMMEFPIITYDKYVLN